MERTGGIVDCCECSIFRISRLPSASLRAFFPNSFVLCQVSGAFSTNHHKKVETCGNPLSANIFSEQEKCWVSSDHHNLSWRQLRSAAEPNWLTRSRISQAVTLRSCPQNAKAVAYSPMGAPPRNPTPLQLWRLLPTAVLLKMSFVLPRLDLIQLANPPPVEGTTNIRCLLRVSVARMLTGQVACS